MAENYIALFCLKCKTDLPPESFTKSTKRPSGRKAYCKRCCAAHERDRRNSVVGDGMRQKDRLRRLTDVRRIENEKRQSLRRAGDKTYRSRKNTEATERLRRTYVAGDATKSCRVCGAIYCNLFGKASYLDVCGDGCSRKLLRISRAKKHGKRRAVVRGAHAEPVDVFKVFDQAKWTCAICGVNTPRNLRGTYSSQAPELDHIIPLAKGGAHSYANVQCACRSCNAAKSDTLAPHG